MSHISEYRVTNFKKLENVSLSNIGKINLILGDNNAGKTSLLESLLFSNNRIELLKNYHKTLCFRDLHIHPKNTYNSERGELVRIEFPEENYLDYIINDSSNYFEIEFKTIGENRKQLIKLEKITSNELTKEDKESIISPKLPGFNPKHYIKFYLDNKQKEIDWLYVDELVDIHKRRIPFITFNDGYGKDLIDAYYNNIHKSKKLRKSFVNNLRFIIPDIEEVMVSRVADKDILSVSLTQYDEPLPITRFGDGAIRVFRILMEITKSKGNRLMIDELSNGIHHSKLKLFWKVIIKAALSNNVQIFATTHSLECLQNYVSAIQELEGEINLNELNCYKLTTVGKKMQTKAYRYNYLQFKTLLESEVEIRGTSNTLNYE